MHDSLSLDNKITPGNMPLSKLPPWLALTQ